MISLSSTQLDGLQELIFLDRYALKDVDEKNLNENDVVVALVEDHPVFPRREVGRVKAKNGVGVDVELKQTGDVIRLETYRVDKPLELYPEQMWERVASAMVEVEPEEKRDRVKSDFLWALRDFRFVPGGRIMAAAGTNHGKTMINCFVLPSPKDSRRGILKTAGDMIEIMAKGGGVGLTISSLRPRSARVYGVNGRSNGSVAWGELYSMVTLLVNQDGGRRGALMLAMNDWHPDLMEFIRDKKKPGRKEGCNMSVLVSDRFMRALKNDELWTFVFPDYEKAGMDVYDEEWDGCLETWVAKGYPVKTYGRLPAREIWDEIIQSAWESGEPGVIFIERANKMANSYYYTQIVGSNPCAEQMLPPNGVCCLGSIVLPRFVDERGVRWDELRRVVHTSVRFLDNVIDTTPYVLDEIREWQAAERRIGLGTMGLGEMLLTMKLRYGSPESLEFVDELYKFIAVEAYRASVHLAIEKGPFPRFDRDAFLASGFMKNMPEEIRRMVWKHGIRNVALLTQAPTGSIGTMVGTSTGIEPFYSWEYFRKGRFGKFREEVAPVKEWRRQNPGQPLPEYFVTAMDLTPEEHMAVQAAIQRWVDASISKTVNMPSWYGVEETKKAYEKAYELGCKGLTVYRDGSREEQVLSIEEMEEEEGELKEVASSCGLVIGPNGVEKTCSM